uniref:DUF659 domain-containing protein n=1 Tax=Lactuca sativa TaxID=4236 RepID=A0A9R1WGJ8_LACSA|nr:hypothetical protein LSAT_V11C200093970 [Lactuca sativa]
MHCVLKVESCIKEVGPENMVQIVTENASNNMGAATLLKGKDHLFFGHLVKHIPSILCFKVLILIVLSIGGLPRYKKSLNHTKTLVLFIYAHHKTLAMMRHFTKKRDIVQPGVTRSAFLTLQSLADKKTQLKQIYGEIQNVKQESINALRNNKKNI